MNLNNNIFKSSCCCCFCYRASIARAATVPCRHKHWKSLCVSIFSLILFWSFQSIARRYSIFLVERNDGKKLWSFDFFKKERKKMTEFFMQFSLHNIRSGIFAKVYAFLEKNPARNLSRRRRRKKRRMTMKTKQRRTNEAEQKMKICSFVLTGLWRFMWK